MTSQRHVVTSQHHVVTSQRHVVTSQRRRDYHSLAIIHTDRVIDKVGNMQQQKHTHRQTDRQTDRQTEMVYIEHRKDVDIYRHRTRRAARRTIYSVSVSDVRIMTISRYDMIRYDELAVQYSRVE